jgi:hypothetical protein
MRVSLFWFNGIGPIRRYCAFEGRVRGLVKLVSGIGGGFTGDKGIVLLGLNGSGVCGFLRLFLLIG